MGPPRILLHHHSPQSCTTGTGVGSLPLEELSGIVGLISGWVLGEGEAEDLRWVGALQTQKLRAERPAWWCGLRCARGLCEPGGRPGCVASGTLGVSASQHLCSTVGPGDLGLPLSPGIAQEAICSWGACRPSLVPLRPSAVCVILGGTCAWMGGAHWSHTPAWRRQSYPPLNQMV